MVSYRDTRLNSMVLSRRRSRDNITTYEFGMAWSAGVVLTGWMADSGEAFLTCVGLFSLHGFHNMDWGAWSWWSMDVTCRKVIRPRPSR